MRRYDIRALRAAARLTLEHGQSAMTHDEALRAVINLADMAEDLHEVAQKACGRAVVEMLSERSDPAAAARWRALKTWLSEKLDEHRGRDDGVPPELLERLRGAAEHDPSLLARAARDAPFRPEMSSYEGEYSVWLPEFDIYGVGDSLEEARTDLLDSVRDYVADWHDRLAEAPNHRTRAALVALVDAADDDAELFTLIFGR